MNAHMSPMTTNSGLGTKRTRRPRLLMLKPFAPYPKDCGGNILTFNLLRELGKEYDVTLLTRRPEDAQKAQDALEAISDKVVFCDPPNLRSMPARLAHGVRLRIRTTVNGKPLAAAYADLAFSVPLGELLSRETYDIVQIDYWNLAELGSLCAPEVARCLFLHDVQPRLLSREAAFAGSWIAAARLRRASAKVASFEQNAFRHFNRILTVTESDAAVYRALLVEPEKVQCVPTLFDVSAARPMPDPGGRTLVFAGAMAHQPNADAMLYFVREVLPIIHADVPQAELVIVGRDVPPSIAKLRSPRVRVTGRVESVEPYLQSAAVYVAPLRFGSGIKIKILEALAYGKALVTTSVGAEGIEIEHRRHCLIADNPNDFAESAIALLRDPNLREGLGKAGRSRVEEKNSAEIAGPRVRSVYRRVIEEFGRNG